MGGFPVLIAKGLSSVESSVSLEYERDPYLLLIIKSAISTAIPCFLFFIC